MEPMEKLQQKHNAKIGGGCGPFVCKKGLRKLAGGKHDKERVQVATIGRGDEREREVCVGWERRVGCQMVQQQGRKKVS